MSQRCENLHLFQGNDELYQHQARQGDPLYAEFYDRAKSYPEETVFNTVAEGLELLSKQRVVIHVSYNQLKSQFKAKPKLQNQNLKVPMTQNL